MACRVRVEIASGLDLGQTVALSTPGYHVFGRGRECFLQIRDPDCFLSRRHFAIEVSADGARVQDLGSRGGTIVNGQALGRRPKGVPPPRSCEWERAGTWVTLADGDEVRAGAVVFRVRVADDGQASVQPSLADYTLASPTGHALGAVLRPATRATGGQPVLLYRATWPAAAGDSAPRAEAPSAVCRALARLASSLIRGNVAPWETVSPLADGLFAAAWDGGNGSVADKVAQHGVLPFAAAREMTLQVAEACLAAHEAGAHHLHLTPSQVRLAFPALGNPRVRVAGFGLAEHLQANGLMGELPDAADDLLPFLAPEQLSTPGVADPRTDVWGAAAVFFYLLTGKPPRDLPPGCSPQAVRAADVGDLARRCPDYGRAVSGVLSRALDADPKRRHPTMREFHRAVTGLARWSGS